MPKFRVRLESPDLTRDNGEPHFRVTVLRADDDAHARRICEQKERELAAHPYPADELAALALAETDAIEGGERPPAAVRGRLAVHRQLLPYTVVDVEEVI